MSDFVRKIPFGAGSSGTHAVGESQRIEAEIGLGLRDPYLNEIFAIFREAIAAEDAIRPALGDATAELTLKPLRNPGRSDGYQCQRRLPCRRPTLAIEELDASPAQCEMR